MLVRNSHRVPLDVQGYVERICFKTGPPGLVGAELEWIVASASAPDQPVPIEAIEDALHGVSTLPGGSVVTFEPGGQVELSSLATDGVTACWQALTADVEHVVRALGDRGLRLLPTAVDPYRPPRRQRTDTRYAVMERYFDRRGPEGRVMMCSTAAIQVNLDAGRDAADVRRRWRLLHSIGPVMVAGFANSPMREGRPTGWRSTRQAIWHNLDPSRTAAPAGPDPVQAWSSYALAAELMVVRDGDGHRLADPGGTFAGWLAHGGHERPTEDDLAYHLTTLFPPERPRGWLEVRYIDTQSVDYWPVPVAVLSALTDPVLRGLLRLGVQGAARRIVGHGSGGLPDDVPQLGLPDPAADLRRLPLRPGRLSHVPTSRLPRAPGVPRRSAARGAAFVARAVVLAPAATPWNGQRRRIRRRLVCRGQIRAGALPARPADLVGPGLVVDRCGG
jgi:glutamate--cysteine ligase